jgi:NADH dehydrogenase
VQQKATLIARDKKIITTADGKEYPYDFAVLGMGVVTNSFGIPGIEKFAYGIKSKQQVEAFVHHLHERIEKTGALDDNYVIVGAGATGVELSAALGRHLRRLAALEGVDDPKINIQLIEAAPRILPRMSERAAKLASKRLEKLGVSVQVGKKVEALTKKSLKVDGQETPTGTVVWTAGIMNNPFFAANKEQFVVGAHGKIAVDAFMQVDDSVYVIGDNAATEHSGLALTAVRDASYVANQLATRHYGSEALPYKQKEPIVVVPVGEHWAIIEYKGVTFAGVIGGILRFFADFVAYADAMPLGMALKTWLFGGKLQKQCPTCGKALQ